MKKNLLLITALFAFVFGAKSQNLILGSTMDDATPWSNGVCNNPGVSPEVDYADETAYGGVDVNNFIGEVDALSCLQQDVNVTPGTVYTINFDATRRIGGCGGATPASPGITVTVTGVPSGTVYSSVDYHYSNATWVGYTTETQVWSIPAVSTDASVTISVTALDNPESCGIVMDNFVMVATGVLPVTLSSFNAYAKGSAVDLNWFTATEISNAYFMVMRSKDGVNFSEIGKVYAAASGSYSFTDPAPVSGYNYYRLKQVDKNGIFKLSGIIKVNLNAADFNALVYPTIVSSVLNYAVESPKAVKLTVMVTDVTGKVVSNTVQGFAAGTTQKNIDVSALATGVYMLTVADSDGSFKKTVKFTKN